MAVLTEIQIRNLLKDDDQKNKKVLEVPKGTIVTPSAKSFLTEHQIKLQFQEKVPMKKDSKRNESVKEEKNISNPTTTHRFQTLCGGFLDEKPEHMTSLYGNILVFKDHKRIIFRGKLDSLESKILETQVRVKALKLQKLVDDLQEVLEFVRNILRCEVLGEEIGEFTLLKMNPAELREISHHPKKYFGSGHFIPNYQMGEIVILLNSLRSAVRETELAAYTAFKLENGDTSRNDIIRALNRLSSLFWIMMFKYNAGQYKE